MDNGNTEIEGGGLVPPLKDTKAVKAGAEAIGISAEVFGDRFGKFTVGFRKQTEDVEHLPNEDFDQVVRRLSSMLKEQDVRHKSPEDAFLCGAALGWAFAHYVVAPMNKPK